MQIQYIDKINVQFCILQQLLKLTATKLNASMTSAYKIMPQSDKYPWCGLNNWLHGPHRGCSTEQFEVGNLWSMKPVIQNTPGIFVRVRQNLVRRCHACIEVGGRQFEQLLQDAKWYVNCVKILHLQVTVNNIQ